MSRTPTPRSEPIHHRVETHAGTVLVEERGSGPALLFIHGALVDGSLWRPLVDRLETSFRCLVPTLPLGSHAQPLRADADLSKRGLARLILEVADELAADRPVVIGNDSGGAISQMTAGMYPEHIGGLVLTNCDALEVFPPPAFDLLLAVARRPWAASLGAKLMVLAAGFARSMPGGYASLSPKVTVEMARAWLRPTAFDAGVRRDVAKVFGPLGPEDTLLAADQLAASDLPVQLVWGAADPWFKLDLAERLAHHIGAQLDVIPGALAYVMLERPDEVAERIRHRWLGRSDPVEVDPADAIDRFPSPGAVREFGPSGGVQLPV